MAWNEPGGSRGKDPWSGRNSEQGPPDLDEIVKKMQDKLGGLFGGGKGGGGGRSGKAGPAGIGIIVLVVLAIWALSGIYVVDQAERGVVLRFGRYVDTTLPGLRWHVPYPIESVQVVNVDQIRNVEIGYRSGAGRQGAVSVPAEALMLTQDENIIDIKFAVQYRVKDAKDYLYNVRDPDLTIKQVTESAVREVIGKSKMDFVLTEGRSEIAARSDTLMQSILDRYGTGLQVTSVNMQDAQPPEEVQAAFADVVKAREDEQRVKNEAEGYSNDIIPKARGAAARQLEEANGYKARVVATAQGETARFLKVLTEYEKAPAVTRDRLYLDTMEQVLEKTGKVLVDVKGSNNLLYLPLDRLVHPTSGRRHEDSGSTTRSMGSSTLGSQGSSRTRDDLRGRGER